MSAKAVLTPATRLAKGNTFLNKRANSHNGFGGLCGTSAWTKPISEMEHVSPDDCRVTFARVDLISEPVVEDDQLQTTLWLPTPSAWPPPPLPVTALPLWKRLKCCKTLQDPARPEACIVCAQTHYKTLIASTYEFLVGGAIKVLTGGAYRYVASGCGVVVVSGFPGSVGGTVAPLEVAPLQVYL